MDIDVDGGVEPTDPSRPSRRRLLRSAGALGGAALLAGAADLTSSAAAEVPAAPVTGFDGAPSAVTSGTNYLTIGQYGLKPTFSSPGWTPSTNGMYCSSSNGNLAASIELPNGTRITEVMVVAFNNTGSTQTATFERSGQFTSWSTLANINMPSTGSLNGVTVTVDHVISADYAYDLLIPTTSNGLMRAKMVRIGYTAPLVFFPARPQVRKVDTRDGTGGIAGKFTTGQTRTVNLNPPVPFGATALVNLTITNTEQAGFISLFPGGTTWPGTSSINWSASGQTIANSATVQLSASSTLNIYCGGSGAPKADVIIDVLGYYA